MNSKEIRIEMLKKGIKQLEICRDLGFKQSTLSMMLRGWREISNNDLKLLSSYIKTYKASNDINRQGER